MSDCPYSGEVKQIFKRANVKYEERILDKLPNGEQIKKALFLITRQNTVPNIFIAGSHIGGCSQLKNKI